MKRYGIDSKEADVKVAPVDLEKEAELIAEDAERMMKEKETKEKDASSVDNGR